jgi:hypothetical protein
MVYSDFNWLPSQDVYGDQVAPPNAYILLTLTSGYNDLTGNANTDWPHTRSGVECHGQRRL